MGYKIIISQNLSKFTEKVEKALAEGWKLHGYTQHPLEIGMYGKDKRALRGQWSQTIIKTDN